MPADPIRETTPPNPWRETVRDIYDTMMLGPMTDRSPAAIIALIETRHRDYLCAPEERAPKIRRRARLLPDGTLD